jgi:hypothetical protein
MEARICLACGGSFEPCKRVKNQKYCSKPECQRERKRRWEREKLADDPAYLENRRNSQKKWRERNPEYWRKYRERNQDYVKKNRLRQRERNARRKNKSRLIAKMDASDSAPGLISFLCELVISREDLIAETDVIRATVRLGSRSSFGPGG